MYIGVMIVIIYQTRWSHIVLLFFYYCFYNCFFKKKKIFFLVFESDRCTRGGDDCLDSFAIFGVRFLGTATPHCVGPCRITFGPPNDMNVHLPYNVANATDVQFARFKVFGNKKGDLSYHACHKGKSFRVELVEVLDAGVDFRDDENPGKDLIVFE